MTAIVIPVILLAILIAVAIFSRFVPFGLYISALAAGVPGLDIPTLIGMRLRRVPPENIVIPLIAANKAGVPVTAIQLQTHYMARGNVDRVVNALISAKRAGIQLDFETAAGIDLAGRNVLEVVQMTINPKVVALPPLKVVTKDGVETESYIQVVLRSNIDNVLQADEAGLIQKLSREIAIEIASADSYQAFADNPSRISEAVLARRIDQGSAFKIVSIDINGIMPIHPVKQ